MSNKAVQQQCGILNNNDSEVCFEGRGVCDLSSLTCTCGDGYALTGDLARATRCTVHILGSKILYSWFIIIWILSFIGGIVAIYVVRRKELRDETIERRILSFIVFISFCYIVASSLVLSSEPYGKRSFGNDIATSVFYAVAMSGNWVLVAVKPLVSVSGLSSSVFTHSGRGREIYWYVFPWIVVGTTISSFMPLALLDPSIDNHHVIMAAYITCSIAGTIMFVFMAYTLKKVRSNIAQALSVNPTLSENQRSRLINYSKRATLLLGIALIGTFVSLAAFCFLGILPQYGRDYSWIVIPLMFGLMGTWCVRHAINNVRLSLRIRRSEFVTSSNYVGEDDDRDDEEGRAESGSNRDSPRPLRPISQFSSSHRKRRLRGVKRKPLELMTAVTERTAEGTVLFTHVDGLDESTACELPRLSSSNHSEELQTHAS